MNYKLLEDLRAFVKKSSLRTCVREISLLYEFGVRIHRCEVDDCLYLVPLSEPPITTQEVLVKLERDEFKTAFAYLASFAVDWDTVLPELKESLDRMSAKRSSSYVECAASYLLWSSVFRNRLRDVLTPQIAKMYGRYDLWGSTDPVTEEMIRRMSKKGGNICT